MNEQELKAALINYLETGAEELLSRFLAQQEMAIGANKIVSFLIAFCKISDEVCPYIEGTQHE
jgi:hypothetical protein